MRLSAPQTRASSMTPSAINSTESHDVFSAPDQPATQDDSLLGAVVKGFDCRSRVAWSAVAKQRVHDLVDGVFG